MPARLLDGARDLAKRDPGSIASGVAALSWLEAEAAAGRVKEAIASVKGFPGVGRAAVSEGRPHLHALQTLREGRQRGGEIELPANRQRLPRLPDALRGAAEGAGTLRTAG